MEITITLVCYTFIIVFDFMPIIKNNQKKITIIYLSLLAISFIIMMLTSIGIKVPSPSNFIKTIVKAITSTLS